MDVPCTRPGRLVPSFLPFSWGKALAFSASDNRPVIKSGLKVTGLAKKLQALRPSNAPRLPRHNGLHYVSLPPC